jgi:hypothetical protein
MPLNPAPPEMVLPAAPIQPHINRSLAEEILRAAKE